MKDTTIGVKQMKVSPLELVYVAAIVCALVLGNTTQTVLGVALAAVLTGRRFMQVRHAHRIHPSSHGSH